MGVGIATQKVGGGAGFRLDGTVPEVGQRRLMQAGTTDSHSSNHENEVGKWGIEQSIAQLQNHSDPDSESLTPGSGPAVVTCGQEEPDPA